MLVNDNTFVTYEEL